MILTRNIAPYLVAEGEPVSTALRKISFNKRGCIFVVDSNGRLIGSLTDGDFRRWVVSTSAPSLDTCCTEVANKDCIWLNESSSSHHDMDIFRRGVRLVPLVDAAHHVISIAEPRGMDFNIIDHVIADDAPSFVVAEIGINHNGNLDTAMRLVDAAANAGANCAKFQLRDLKSLYRTEVDIHGEDIGAQYSLDLIREMALSVDETLQALDYVSSVGLVPLCTPWDRKSAEVLIDYGVPAFKVASADLTNHPLVELLASTGHPLIVSTGMSTEDEICETVKVLQRGVSNFALLQCSSAYPAPYKDLNLAYMGRLAEIAGCHVGYSGHERGHHVAVAAVAMGARLVEKHITLDRTARGNDHRVSLDPKDFKIMVKEMRDVEAAIGSVKPRIITQGESLNRLSLSKSLVAARDIQLGEILRVDDVAVKSPGRGLQPNALPSLLGITLKRAVIAGEFFYPTDIHGPGSQARHYIFNRPWGLPVRFHDWRSLSELSNPDFLEFHLSYRDLEVNFDQSLDSRMPFGLVVHSPDLFTGDLILDLAAEDKQLRQQSIFQLQRVVDLTRTLLPRFTLEREPVIVASLGGSTLEQPASMQEKNRMYERVIDSLGHLDLADVNLVAQTLPPYPWYLGGQRHCNLFVDPTETAQFSQDADIELCFDIAHTKLATNHARSSFSEAASILLPRTAHLHLVDAAGLDDEGLQILEGEVDWVLLATQLEEFAPRASFIPEIWQGHVDGGDSS